MKTFSKTTLAALMLALSLPAVAKGPKVDYTHAGVTAIDMKNANKVKWLTVEQIRDSLKNTPPMTVTFDIDDTVLVSSQCFYYGKNTFSPDSYDYLHNQAFWNFVADGCDRMSIPKESAKKLIDMHQARGDQVIFITGRTGHANNDPSRLDVLGTILERTFKVKNMQPINYTNDTPVEPYKYDKTHYIVKHKSQLHYGDSNDDVLAAREAGIRGIRVMRPPVSTNRPLPINGGYGEEVLVDSSY
ncbi:acid phosphatase AphA [Alysiella filiformis]|uniref:Class B acid phosphatase n=1 Tax=Alysiella filiformis DSM 16848 TaxID=1120981 RepID=A0A286E5H6_9NEIS|nr:acid phosphatase AphA [Alysiella filiformis]QMT30379.1 acid phosphatase AphA [Alysiella filiformis]UBQ56641.1 acid phosphatase AphA [Alysiella filiformis DSM 16848]SOD66155.1 acid phosphatase (class B) [Alysiella filiformis DSM 16848]